MKIIRVLVVDDESIVREGIAALLSFQNDFEVIGKARDGVEAVELADKFYPDVILLDTDMPRQDGLTTIPILRERTPNSRILVLSSSNDDNIAYQAFKSGAVGYLLKDMTRAGLFGAIRNVAEGRVSTEQRADVFISYARDDIDIVQKIYKTLLQEGHHPWMDVHSIKGGEKWLRAIYKSIDECEIFLAILSNNSVSRRGVIQKELKKALDKWEGMLPEDIYILPIRIDDSPIPELLKDIHILDWDNGKGGKKLLDAIKVGLVRRKGSYFADQD